MSLQESCRKQTWLKLEFSSDDNTHCKLEEKHRQNGTCGEPYIGPKQHTISKSFTLEQLSLVCH